MSDEILNLIGNSTCRRILKATSKSYKSINQLKHEYSLPSTTLYRIIPKMVSAKMLIVRDNYTPFNLKESVYKTRTNLVKAFVIDWVFDL